MITPAALSLTSEKLLQHFSFLDFDLLRGVGQIRASESPLWFSEKPKMRWITFFALRASEGDN